MRSFGDRRGIVPLTGASGRQEAGTGEEGLSGELQAELEGWELASDGRKSSRGKRESGGGREVPAVASGVRSRPRQSRSRPVLVVWSLRWMLAARGGWQSFRTIFWSCSNDQARLQLLGRRVGFSGWTVGCRRPGELSTAPRLERSAPGDCWGAGGEV